jgi:serine phosphatase RsbU (regulator of sigma subunit)
MDQVGGDFFDFFHFRDSRKIGIFLSDVSGHGIPAALITSMIKSFILQAGTYKENPSELMWYLNDLLFSQIKGNFVTAFYCIYDPETCQILYSNAGHNPPFIISNGSISSLEIQNTTPLGIMSNNFLKEHEKHYTNNFKALEKGNKVILLTDGLADTTDTADRTKYFGDDTMNGIMIRNAALPHNEFIEELMKEAALYHGSDSFEDDVCVICIDV